MRGGFALTAAACVAFVSGSSVADVVERRGREPAIEGRVSGLDEAGVYLKSESGATYFVPWDRVRRVSATPPDPTLARRMVTATELWRARSRVERGDTALAEPLLERLFERFRGTTHETALVVAEGLLRCRLARGANALALIPALEVARLRRADVATASYANLRPVLDETTGFCPQLAPAWATSRALLKLERDLTAYLADAAAAGDAVVASIARRYLLAVRRQLDGTPGARRATPDAAPEPAHPGVAMLDLLVRSGDAEASRREEAREEIARAMTGWPDWAEGWARFALGTSLLGERGARRRMQGMVHLVHLPARFGRELPYLSGLALAWLAEAHRVDGDAVIASAMESELDRLYPNHPVRSLAHPIRITPPEDDSP